MERRTHTGSSRCIRARQGTAAVRGFTLVMVLAWMVVLSVALSVVGPRWADQTQRDREAELLKVGRAYAKAIASYYYASDADQRSFPKELALLLDDSRFTPSRKHLRQLYPDPLEPSRPWGLVRAADGGVRGVFSQDGRQPKTQVLLVDEHFSLPPARQYTQWVFAPTIQ